MGRTGGVVSDVALVRRTDGQTAPVYAGIQRRVLFCSAALSDSYRPGLGCAALRADVLIPQE